MPRSSPALLLGCIAMGCAISGGGASTGKPSPAPVPGECHVADATKAQIPAIKNQPRSDWFNVMDFGAVGDGVTDDWLAINNTVTAAQKALPPAGLNDFNGTAKGVPGQGINQSCTVYFPAGQYRVTKTIAMVRAAGCAVIGDGISTRIFWDGEVGGKLFWSDGMPGSRFSGIHWDCNGKALNAFWHNSFTLFETDLVHEFEQFSNCLGIAVAVDSNHTGEPRLEKATAESHWVNCVFENSLMGIQLSYANCYDFTFDGCIFRNNSVHGINSLWGIFYVRNSNFYDNGNGQMGKPDEAGMILGCDINSGVYWAVSSVRRAVSVGSRHFVCTQPGESMGWSTDEKGFMKVEGCYVEGFTGNAAIRSNGQLHVSDVTFVQIKPSTNSTHALIPYTAGLGANDTWPLLLAGNLTVVNLNFTNFTWPANYTATVATGSKGACPPAPLDAKTTFFSCSSWPFPGQKAYADVRELLSDAMIKAVSSHSGSGCATFISGPNGLKENITDYVTMAVQQTIDTAAALAASTKSPMYTKLDGAPVAYFPAGCYAVNKPINISGANYWIIGAGQLKTHFVYVGPEPNSPFTSGVFDVAAGTANVSFDFLGTSTSDANSTMARLLVRGSASPKAMRGNATVVRVNGFYGGGYSESRRPLMSFSGIRVLDMGPLDSADIQYVNGDLEVHSNFGTVITGFHLTGVTVVSPSVTRGALLPHHLQGNGLSNENTLFVGELMTFKCCDQAFSEYIFGGGLSYVVGDYYQESGPQHVYATKNPYVPQGSAAVGRRVSPSKGYAQVVLSTTKAYGYNETAVDLEDFDGLFAFIGGTISTQGGSEAVVQIRERTTAGKSAAKIVVAGSQFMYDNTTGQTMFFKCDVSPTASASVVANSWTNDTGFPGRVPAQTNEDSAAQLTEALDALRRLGRIDLQLHYPSLGVVDTCSMPSA